MFSFLGLRKDSKKSSTEKEVEGGFVIIGETVEEQRRKMQAMNIAQPSTNVVVHSSRSSCRAPAPAPPISTNLPAPLPTFAQAAGASAVEAAPSLPDLLGDVPFALAPHILAMQTGFPLIPDVLMSRDINYNLATFQYDFTLENSVLHNA
ncbi:UBAP1-MVB12-associated (UMA)-domain containing protein 1 [Notolabrus celidotus]|uniref:UBAP1-MVB12-associated (UMA)-domain containing protein 1 n=1 Tax=Notolabrus celidotus TaxID=1203425 RepID=UPI00148FE3EA|nr:UBAP1-MVB12-associated (UMA)-domain containing protein 1 [Notolabrus celidotus]